MLDSLLIDEQYSNIPTILDYLFKAQEPLPEWVRVYNTMPLQAIVSRLPQVHLITELTKDKKQLADYFESLEQQKGEEIPWSGSLQKGIDSVGVLYKSGKLAPITHRPLVQPTIPDAEYDSAIQSLCKNHSFVQKHQKVLTHLTLQPLEILYPLNAMGKPLPPNRQQKLERETVASVNRTLFEQSRPIRKDHLLHLKELATSTVPKSVNPKFFKSIAKSRKSNPVSPLKKKYLQQRKNMPTPNSIKKIIREYVMKQYYWDSETNKYMLSPLKDFYETDKPKVNLDLEPIK